MDPIQATDQEERYEPDREQHRYGEAEFPLPHRAQPGKYLNPGRYADQKAVCGEEHQGSCWHSSCKHVVNPDSESQKTNGDC